LCSGGVLKQGHIRLVSSDSSDPEEVIQEYVKYYGESVKLKYVPVENASDYLEKFAEKLVENDDKSRLDDNFFHFGSVDAATILREVTDAKAAKQFSMKKKDDGDDDKSGDEDDKKSSKKSSKKKDEDEDEDDKKPAKKSTKKSSKKKDESEDEEKDKSEDEDEKKSKKSTKKSSKKNNKKSSKNKKILIH